MRACSLNRKDNALSRVSCKSENENANRKLQTDLYSRLCMFHVCIAVDNNVDDESLSRRVSMKHKSLDIYEHDASALNSRLEATL